MDSLRYKIKRIFNYEFQDIQLLQQALTHRSANVANNERLEFLGDSVLGMLIAAELYHKFPKFKEGELTRSRSRLVRKETLAEIARRNNIGSLIVMGDGAAKSGGADRSSILADVLESIIGAIYLEEGLNEVQVVLKNLFSPEWESLETVQVKKDPKTELQERMQKSGRLLPKYSVERSIGEPHDKEFTVTCTLDHSGEKFQGCGASRQKAEQNAAACALSSIEHTDC